MSSILPDVIEKIRMNTEIELYKTQMEHMELVIKEQANTIKGLEEIKKKLNQELDYWYKLACNEAKAVRRKAQEK